MQKMEQLHTLLAQPPPTSNASRLQTIFSRTQDSLLAPHQHYLVFCRLPHTQQHKPVKKAVPTSKEKLSPHIPTLTQKLPSQLRQPTTTL